MWRYVEPHPALQPNLTLIYAVMHIQNSPLLTHIQPVYNPTYAPCSRPTTSVHQLQRTPENTIECSLRTRHGPQPRQNPDILTPGKGKTSIARHWIAASARDALFMSSADLYVAMQLTSSSAANWWQSNIDWLNCTDQGQAALLPLSITPRPFYPIATTAAYSCWQAGPVTLT